MSWSVKRHAAPARKPTRAPVISIQSGFAAALN
jgi:hypothetical protein